MGIDSEAWNHIWTQFTASVGTTWNDYARTLRTAADRLSAMGRFTSQPSILLNLAMDQVLAGEPRQTWRVAPTLCTPGRDYPSSSTLLRQRARHPLRSGAPGARLDPLLRSLGAGAGRRGTPPSAASADRAFSRKGSSGEYRGRDGDAGRLVKAGSGFALTESNGTVFSFNGEGRLSTIREYKGNTLTCAYDGTGRLVSVAHGDGGSHRAGLRLRRENQRLTDAAGRGYRIHLRRVGGAPHLRHGTRGRIITYEYTAAPGQATEHALAAVAYPDGTHRAFTYDASGHLSGMSRDGGEEAVSLSYAEMGKVGVASGGSTFTFTLDGREMSARHRSPGGTGPRSRGMRGNPTRVVDPSGGRWDLTYGPLGNVTSIRDPLGSSSGLDYAYPTTGGARVTGVVDGNGNRTVYERGEAGLAPLAATVP